MGLRVTDLIEAALQRHGDRVAVADESGALTFAQLSDRARRFAAALQAMGIRKGDRVAMVMDNCKEWVEVEFAIALCGGVRARLNVRDSAREFQWILSDAAPKVLIADAQRAVFVRTLIAAGTVPNLAVVEIGQAGQYEKLVKSNKSMTPVPIEENDLYQIMHTSGTSGKYKGAVYTHRGWASLIRNALALLMGGLTPDHAFLHVGPLSHQSGLLVLPGLLVGMRSEIRARFEPSLFFKTVETQRITHTILSPTLINMLVQHPGSTTYDLSSLEAIYYSASPIAPTVLSRAIELFGPILLQIYGSTEAPYNAILYPEEHTYGLEHAPERLSSCGRKTPFCDLRITDETGDDVGVGGVGEIRVRSDAMSEYYWNQPGATSEAYVDGWFRTGDLAARDADGFITIVDRASDAIISGGLNVYPREVEDVISSHPTVREVCVFGIPDEKWGEAVKACVVLKDGAKMSLGELQHFCIDLGLASYKKPLSLDVLTEIPKTSVGKLSRRLLREKYWAGRPRLVG